MYRHEPAIAPCAALHTSFGKPTDQFGCSGNAEVSKVGVDLDHKLAGVLDTARNQGAAFGREAAHVGGSPMLRIGRMAVVSGRPSERSAQPHTQSAFRAGL